MQSVLNARTISVCFDVIYIISIYVFVDIHNYFAAMYTAFFANKTLERAVNERHTEQTRENKQIQAQTLKSNKSLSDLNAYSIKEI